MNSQLLRNLRIRLNGLRDQKEKEKFAFQRKGKLIRVVTYVDPIGKIGFTNYMKPIELMRWLEGCVYGYNSCWYHTEVKKDETETT